jgi:predicted dehydrogenase
MIPSQMLPSIHRRQFVKAAAAAAIATAQFPILGANDRIRIGQVGLGGRGRDHVNYYSSLDSECQVVAICDVNQAARERGAAMVRKLKGYDPKEYDDMRAMFESKDIDAVSITTPNHWHALATIWACQAGKDVYVEKPACHNVYEGRQMVAAARKYNRMVQVGSQSRSTAHKIRAMKLLQDGIIGQVYHARGLCFRRRFSIGHTPDEPVPPGLEWDRFLGPAQWKPYSKNKFAYNWHWFWDTGNGDIGNQGIHEMDICLWGLGRTAWPQSVSSTGGKYVWKDDQQTANTQQSAFDFGDAQITFDVRNLPTLPEGLVAGAVPNYTGNQFFGEDGFLVVDPDGFQVYKSAAANIKGEAAHGAGAGKAEKYEKIMDEKAQEHEIWATTPHMKNFLDAVRARDHKLLNADVAVGTHSADFVHMANISLRTGRTLHVEQSAERFIDDEQANGLLTRDYREPYVVPREV